MTTPLDLSLGQQVGQWTITGLDGGTYRNGDRKVVCQCSCGQIRNVSAAKLRARKTSSCFACSHRRRALPPINSGQTYGKWTVLATPDGDDSYGRMRVICQCMCGTVTNLPAKYVAKCGPGEGCVKCKDSPGLLRHGHTRHRIISPEWRAWSEMKRRCENPNCYGWRWYGALGIKVCERWQVFENFLADMGPHPGKGYSLDRFPNKTGNYEPGNCRWATRAMQHTNMTSNRLLTLHDETHPLSVWARKTGMSADAIRSRLNRGWSDEKALTTPIDLRISLGKKRAALATPHSGKR